MSTKLSSLNEAPAPAAQVFYPLQTVRCTGPAVFKSQLARDIACLFDIDDSIVSWSCLPKAFEYGGEIHRPDFIVQRTGVITIVDVSAAEELPAWLSREAATDGYQLEALTRPDLPAIRLRNAKDLLRYARYEVGLDERVRLLAALDENGTLSIAECMPAFRAIPPIAGLASLILGRFVAVDLDEAPIGPETIVRRYRG